MAEQTDKHQKCLLRIP